MRQYTLGPLLLILWLLLIAFPAGACNVPVFRYALEYWPPDPYRVSILRHLEMADHSRALVQQLEEIAQQRPDSLHVDQIVVEAQPDHPFVARWRKEGSPTLPQLWVQYPESLALQDVLWQRPLTQDTVSRLLSSPKRGEIAQHIRDGSAAVWLFVESSQGTYDDAVLARLELELERAASNLHLPPEYEDFLRGIVGADLDITFPIVRISRTEVDEEFLVQNLLQGLEEEAKQPILIPLFGRGRALYALTGEEINRNSVEKACRFLVDRCSCQVKELNPGWDILMPIDWDILAREQPGAYVDDPSLALNSTEPIDDTGSTGVRRGVILFLLIQGALAAVGLPLILWWRRQR